jgi:glutathione S-transferase
MRARLALLSAQLVVELREIELKNKPEALLLASPKATVPVLVLCNNRVIDESIEIMHWALQKNDPENWLKIDFTEAKMLIDWNDGEFKYFLDRYKYADRYPDFSQNEYRQRAERFLVELEHRLHQHIYLCGDHFSLADAAILPFIRQFTAVDSTWFELGPYIAVQHWLSKFVDSKRFRAVMSKYAPWKPDDIPLYFDFE